MWTAFDIQRKSRHLVIQSQPRVIGSFDYLCLLWLATKIILVLVVLRCSTENRSIHRKTNSLLARSFLSSRNLGQRWKSFLDLGGFANSYQDSVTRLRVRAHTLQCLIRHVLAIVTFRKQRYFSESENTHNKSVAVKFSIYFPNQFEIDSNKIGSLWLLSKKVQ